MITGIDLQNLNSLKRQWEKVCMELADLERKRNQLVQQINKTVVDGTTGWGFDENGEKIYKGEPISDISDE